MSSKIFEEAIADAKKLKTVAEENAKKAILEAVTPRIREFIEDQLLEDDDADEGVDAEILSTYEEDEAEMEEEIVLDETAIASLLELLGGEDAINSLQENKEVFNESVKEALENLTTTKRNKILNLVDKINESADKLSAKNINNNKSIQENDEMSKEKFYEVDLRALRESIEKEMDEMAYEGDETEEAYHMEEDDDLEEMLAEIKLMLDLGEDIEEDQLPEELRGMLMDEDEGDEPELEMADEDMADEEAGEDMPADDLPELPMPELPDAEGEDLNEVFEIDPRILRQELARVRQQISEGKVEHHYGGKGGGKAGVDGAYGGKGKKNAGVKGAFGGGKEGQDAFTNPPQINKLNEAIRHLRRKNRSQQEKLTKYRSAVHTLREQLEDLNLFNAKLLYVNKLLQNKGLTESQKKSVIKALDEAKSLTETKTLYKSLTESLTSKKPLNESNRYGRSSRTTTSSSSTRTEAAGEMSRWQRLAGLTK